MQENRVKLCKSCREPAVTETMCEKHREKARLRTMAYRAKTKLQSVKPEKHINPNNHYFNNKQVEALLIRYLETACTNITLRNEILSHATELIRQVVMKLGLNKFSGKNMDELIQVAWVQIEKTLYKFNASPGHTTLFNMWTSIAKTVLLAYIKREKRDSMNSTSLKYHKINHFAGTSFQWERFLLETREFYKYDDEALKVIDGLDILLREDERPSDGFITKLIRITKLRRLAITKFLSGLKLFAGEFTDSPFNMVRERIILTNEERLDEE